MEKIIINEASPIKLIKNFKSDSNIIKAIESVLAHSATSNGRQIVSTKAFDIHPNKTVITDVETLIKAIDAGALSAKTIGQIETGMLKYGSTPSEILDSIANSLVSSKAFNKKYGSLSDNELKKILKNNGYSQGGIDSIIKSRKKINKTTLNTNQKNSATQPSQTPQTPQAPNGISQSSDIVNNITDKLIKLGKIKMGLKIVSFFVVGGVGYYLLSDGSKVKSDNQDMNTLKNQIEPCLRPLLDKGGYILLKNENPLVILKKTGDKEIDDKGGLVYYPNGRVFTGDKSQRGTWNCNTKNIIKESLRGKLKSLLNEEVDMLTLVADVDKMIDFLDTPVSESDLKNALDLLKKYSTETINGQNAGKVFLKKYEEGGLGYGDIKTSLKYIVTVYGTSKYYKNELLKLVNQIETNKVEKTAPLNNVNIIWDKNSLKKQPKIEPINKVEKKSQYFNCTSFPFQKFCKSNEILDIQKKLNFLPKYQDGKLGDITIAKLENLGFDMSNGLTKEIYLKIMDIKPQETTPTNVKKDEVQFDNNPKDNFIGPPTETDSFKTSNTDSTNINATDTVTTDTTPTTDTIEQPNNAMRDYISKNIKRNIFGNIVYNGGILDDNQNKFLDSYIKERFGFEYTRDRNLEKIGKNRQRTVFKK